MDWVKTFSEIQTAQTAFTTKINNDYRYLNLHKVL